MPKLSIYVADDLWDEVRDRHAGLNPSQTVQTALRRLLDNDVREVGFAAFPPVEAVMAVERLKSRFVAEASNRYQHGYRAAVDLADTEGALTWPMLDEFSACQWDLRKWIAGAGDSADNVRSLLTGTDWTGGSDPTFERGFTDGLRSIWNAVMGRDTSSAPPSQRNSSGDFDEH